MKDNSEQFSLKSSNTVWHHATVTRERRKELNNHKSVILWFTGLSGCGKSTVANEVATKLHKMEVISLKQLNTILGSVKDFDLKEVEIGSWSPTGSRVLSRYEHVLDYDLLKKLKDTGELTEFLVVNKQVVHVIG